MNRWSVVIGAPGRSWSVELPGGRSAVVGQGDSCSVQIVEAGLAERHVSLLPRDEGVLVEPLRDGGDFLVNDVPATAQSTLRSGDELRVGDARLIFTMVAPVPVPRPRIVGFDEFTARLEEEVQRAGVARPLGLVLVASPGLNVAARQALVRRVVDEVHRADIVACFGDVTNELFAVSLPEVEASALSALFKRLPVVVGPRASLATARAPHDGLDAETLMGACWDVIVPDTSDEPVCVDATMVRLQSLAESLAEDEGAVCVVGAPGSGRATLLQVLARAAGRRLTLLSALDDEALSRGVSKAGDWWLVRDVDRLDAAGVSALRRSARTRLLATAEHAPGGNHFEHVIEVPPLRSRPDDVLPLAEAFVSRARAAVGRPRLTLGHDARGLLQSWRWPGNVRELKNVLARAARGAVRDEIGRDALPAKLSGESQEDDFRGAMQSAERELLLETLARTRWNVTAAALRLGIPRRTIVHRMAKLGLKRPAR
ncbi:MAG: helix-turn-helix domain-containing protein [Archangium sp.]